MIEGWELHLHTKGYQANTIKIRLEDLRFFMKNAGIRTFAEITKDLVLDYAFYTRQLYPSSNSVQRRLSSLRQFLKFKKSELAEQLDTVKVNRKGLVQIYSTHEMTQIFDSLNKKSIIVRTMLEIFYATGIRRSELANIQIFDVNLSEKSVIIRRKGGATAIVPLTITAVKAIENYLTNYRSKLNAPMPNLFIRRTGNCFHPNKINTLFDNYKKHLPEKLRGRFRPHIIRHSIASHLIKLGASIRTIQEFLGHSTLDCVDTYTHYDLSEIKDALSKYHPLNSMELKY
jgi:site-specific recombinase XerD